MAQKQDVKIGLLGAGTVGLQVARILHNQQQELAARAGANLVLSAVAVRDTSKVREGLDQSLLTTDIDAVINSADLVIELMGGLEPARSAMLKALEAGKTVVTGNKAVLAQYGPELYETAARTDANLYFEAAVAGAVPVVYGLRESLTGDRINKVLGIVNGTTNYILDQMTTQGWSYEQALHQAQELGYAEADPSADVGGHDAAAKCAILASLAFHTRVNLEDVPVKGITEVSAQDIKQATESGYAVKLLARAERVIVEGEEQIALGVEPTLVPQSHPLASITGPYNAIVLETEFAGRLMFYGAGAGGAPTASAVLSDVVAGANHLISGGHAPRESVYAALPICEPGRVETRRQVRLEVADRIEMMAEIAKIYAAGGVSIASLTQSPTETVPDEATLVISTHRAQNSQHDGITAALAKSPIVRKIASEMSIEQDQ
ncbi:homoserine dehydrogenase [Mobiluncus curtisii]|uniref:homoserine dehydrogenase n=1 Tax=Mobiluncus curtisii TaxID=2051 RepID=UPI00146FFD0E|nr:homoserine dehydrogenase [Mobiluncus curtisii]NMW83221.1 homoserine dehydrogenase [Mobiluncus curtisii]NMW98817.1 homoserine dehydrogenase [Mobiluncus curtisii]NMX05832.1 homoserine dehydrogenase [Mobiluncus curtisii]